MGATAMEEQTQPLQPNPHYDYGIPIQDPSPPTYILLPLLRRRRRPHCLPSLLSSSSLLLLSLTFLLLSAALFLLFPSDPEIQVVRLDLHKLRVRLPSLDVSLGLKIKIRNPDFFSLKYRSIDVAIGYRGRTLGSVRSGGGRVRARGVSYVDAELKLDGIQVIHDALYLIEDLARGSVPFDTVTEVDGKLRLLFLDVPVRGKLSCEMNVNPDDETVIHQDCYPE